jgi:hypothetical protein
MINQTIDVQPRLKLVVILALLICIPSACVYPEFIRHTNHDTVHAVFLLTSHAMKASTVGVQKSKDVQIAYASQVPAFFGPPRKSTEDQLIAMNGLLGISLAPPLSLCSMCILRT